MNCPIQILLYNQTRKVTLRSPAKGYFEENGDHVFDNYMNSLEIKAYCADTERRISNSYLENEKNKDKINTLILENKELFNSAFLKNSFNDDEIKEAEKSLNFKIPEEYLWFLKTYGHGGYGNEFLGYSINREPLFVKETLYERNYGLPNNLLVIENCDEYLMCIDITSKKIVSWSKHDTAGVIEMFNNFYDFFIDCINQAIKNP